MASENKILDLGFNPFFSKAVVLTVCDLDGSNLHILFQSFFL